MSNPIQAPESAQTWPASMLGPRQRALAWERLGAEQFDVVVIGGGVVGSGCALDAATRGLKVALVEARDFASGTSSRSSKMFHGGLRYLEQLEFGLVREALYERELSLTTLAPHLVKPLPFLFPLTKRWWERPYVAAGIFLYDRLGGAKSVPAQKHLTRAGALRLSPGLKRSSLIGGIRYYDTVVDDARHTMTVARTAAHYGAVVRSSTQVVALLREGDRVTGVRVRDSEDGADHRSPRPRRGQRDRGVDRRDPGVVQAARPLPGARVQGRARRGAAGPDRQRRRDHPAHREVGDVRHPVGQPLDHRNHRHRLEPRPGPPRGHQGRHRLHPRHRQHRAGHPVDARRHRRGVRRAAAAAGGGERGDLQAVPGARRGGARARPGRHRRRQVHHLPGDGRRRDRRCGAVHPGPGGAVDHREGAAAGRRRLLRADQPGRARRRAGGPAPLPGAPSAGPLRFADRRGAGAWRPTLPTC